jgi:membrane fusion protein, multidrug efflux system
MTERARKPRFRIFIILAVVVLAGAGIAYAAWTHYSGREATEDAQVDGHINPVNTKIGGIVKAVHVKENQFVNAGDVLVEIDTRDYDVALTSAEAELADARAQHAVANAGVPVVSTQTGARMSGTQAAIIRSQGAVESAQKDIDAARARLNLAKARVAEAQANYTRAAKDVERFTPLVEKDEIPRQQYDAAVAGAAAAKATLESMQAGVLEAESGIAAAEARLTQARGSFGQAEAEAQAANTGPQEVAASRARVQAAAARIDVAHAAIAQVRLNLNYATIKAPVSGVVSRKNVEPGQVVQPGQPLLAVVPLEEVWVTANFKETQLESMKTGQTAIISVDAYGSVEFTGRVESIAAATGARFSLLPPENASGNYVKVVQRVPVRIALDRNADPEHVLRPGMSVVATVKTEP